MNHEAKVKIIIEQVKKISASSQKVTLLKSSVSHFVPNVNDLRATLPKINIRSLNEIIEIDLEEKTCMAEPGVTFYDLVNATMQYNLIPCNVPELKTITIGGAISGCSVESMSYKFGGFHDTCLEYEIITGNGELITCSPDKNSDIFHMIHGSYGTMGILSKIKFKLIEAKPFVKMEYKLFDNFNDYWTCLKDCCDNHTYDFVDGIIHDKDKLVACLGNMVESVPYISSYEWLNIFYKSTLQKREDCLTISDYFFRYDTECHWMTRTVPLMENKIVRFLIGKAVLGSTNMIKYSKKLKSLMKMKKRPEVVVDLFIPSKKFDDFFQWYSNDFKFYPLWIVPYKTPAMYPWISEEHAAKINETFLIDCAIYGKSNNEDNIDYSEVLERKTYELNGIKTLISRNHYDESTFWKIYNRKEYTRLKAILDPNNIFNTVFDKLVAQKR